MNKENLVMLRSFFKMGPNIKTHSQYQGNDNNLTDNSKENWIYIHFLFMNQAPITNAIVIIMFNVITEILYWSIWTNKSLSFLANFIRLVFSYHKMSIIQQGFIKLTKKTLISVLTLWIVMVGTGLLYLFGPWNKSSEAAWFDDNWAFRKAITFTHNAAVSTPSQVVVQVDTTAAPDSFQSDCGDVRFTDPNGRLLKYYHNPTGGAGVGCDDASSDFDVLMPTIINGSNLIYMYYGNPSVVNGTEAADFSDATTTPSGGAPAAASEEKGVGPTLYWKLDDTSIGTAQDESSNNLDGTHNNTPTIQTEDMCVSGKCLWFDGANNENVSLADPSSGFLDFGATASFSVTAWVKRNGASSAINYIQSKADTTNGGYKLWMDASGDLCVGIDDDTTWDPDVSACTSAIDFDDDKWHYVVGVRDVTGDTLYLYVDGLQRASASDTTTATLANGNIFYVGVDRDGTSNEWLGFIDEVKVYPYARSAAQVRADYNRGTGNEGQGARFGTDPNNLPNALSNGLAAYWKLDQSATPSTDSSGNSNSGTWTNNVEEDSGKFGSSIALDGTNDYVEVADSNSLDVTNITISAWITSGPTTGTILQKSTAAGTDGYSLDISSDKIRFCSAGGCASADTTLSPANSTGTVTCPCAGGRIDDSTKTWATNIWNEYQVMLSSGTLAGEIRHARSNDGDSVFVAPLWTEPLTPAAGDAYTIDPMYHVVVTFDGTTTRFYLNGVADGTSTTITSIPTNALVLRMGVDSSSAADFQGLIDEVRLYNRALNPSEVFQLYNFTPGPVVEYKFDEATGQTVNDTSGYGRSGTLGSDSTVQSSDPTWSNGRYGGGLFFDGSDDFVAGMDLDFARGPFAITGWFKNINTSLTNVRIVDKGCSGNYSIVAGQASPLGGVAFSVGVSVGDSSKDWRDSQWHHVAGVLSNSQIYLYLDGTLRDTTDHSNALTTNNAPFRVGKCTTEDFPFNGYIDEVRIYNYKLAGRDVVSDMNATHPAPGSPVGSSVAYWKFDEGYSTTANDSASQNGSENLTMSAATIWTNSGKFGKALNGATNVRASLTDDADLDFAAAEDLSISFWFKSDSTTNPSANEYLVEKGGNIATDAVGYAIYTSGASDGLICFGIDDDATSFPEDSVCSASDFYDNTWHHLLAKKTGTTRLDLYIDGKPNGTADTSISATGTLANAATFFVGDTNSTDGTDEFLGDIDELKVFRSALTEAEVRNEYNRGSSQALGALSDDTDFERQAAAQEYCVPGDTSCTSSASSPVGRWDFEEGSGTTANDSSTNANTGTLTNGPTWTSGKFGKALSFDLSDDLVNAGSGTTLDNIFDAGGTIIAWIYVRSDGEADEGTLWSKGGTSYNFSTIGESAGKVKLSGCYRFSGPDGCWDTTNTEVTLNTWTHVAVVYNADSTTNDPTYYINGRAFTVGNGLTETFTPSGTRDSDVGVALIIGATNASGTFVSDGIIDQVRVYDYSRSAAQIAWDYNRGLPIGHWKMDECQGTTINDSSGNSLTGTLTLGGGYTSAGDCTTSATTAWYDGRTGKYNSSLAFDGNYISVSDNAKLDITNSITVSTWIKANNISNKAILGKWTASNLSFGFEQDGAGNDEFIFYTDADGASGSNCSVTSTDANISTGTWYHVVATSDGSTDLRLYLNGRRLSATVSGSGCSIYAGTANLIIGALDTTPTLPWYGQLDDVKIFNYALTATQVKILYNSGAARFGPVTGSP